MQLIKKLLITTVLISPVTVGAAILEADALISGENIHYIDGPVSVNAAFSEDSSFLSTDPVFISQSASIRGVGLSGTSLGRVKVDGYDNGFFSVGTFGQANHFNESRFRFTETITNTTAINQLFSMNFEISAGQLETTVSEVPPTVGEFLQAEYNISISFNGVSLFESGATLRQVGAGDGTNTVETLSLTGTSLGGVLTNPATGAPDTFLYTWNDFIGSVDLDELTAGESGLLVYDIHTRGSGAFDQCGSSGCGRTFASIGDPLDLSSIGAPGDITSTPIDVGPPSSVPVPATIWLFGTALFGLIGFSKRRG